MGTTYLYLARLCVLLPLLWLRLELLLHLRDAYASPVSAPLFSPLAAHSRTLSDGCYQAVELGHRAHATPAPAKRGN